MQEAPTLRAQLNETHEACYYRMFKDCTSLKYVQTILPSIETASYCYEEMYAGCTSLETAPIINATNLTLDCFANMFNGCINLKYLNVKFDTWKQIEYNGEMRYVTTGWVKDVSSINGSFICPDTLTKQYGDDFIPSTWQ